MPLSRSKRGLASTCAVLLTLGLATAARASADGTFAPALIVDGPSTGVSLLGDVEMAFDSSAVVSYVRSDEGADHAFYERFLRQKLYKLPGVKHTRSTFTLRCLKRAASVAP